MSGIIIQLLHPTEGHPLQTWSFDEKGMITLGRSSENDVVVADPYVSRSHAYLHEVEGEWKLVAISQKKLYYKGLETSEVRIGAATVCQLGAHGCLLRIGALASTSNSQTISFDQTQMPFLVLDGEKMLQEVNQIAKEEYFEALKETARQMREQRQER